MKNILINQLQDELDSLRDYVELIHAKIHNRDNIMLKSMKDKIIWLEVSITNIGDKNDPLE